MCSPDVPERVEWGEVRERKQEEESITRAWGEASSHSSANWRGGLKVFSTWRGLQTSPYHWLSRLWSVITDSRIWQPAAALSQSQHQHQIFCFNWFRFPPRQFPCRTAELFFFFFPSWNFVSLPGLLNYTLKTGFTVAYHLFLALLQTSGPRRPFSSAGMRILPLSLFLSLQFHHSFGWVVAAAVLSRQWLLCLK